MKNMIDVEKSIKSFLKRSKTYSYSTALLVTFLITGHVAYPEEKIVITEEIVENVPTRQQLDSQIDVQKTKLNSMINANENSIDRIGIKVAQLLEQATQVVKPWDKSWQFGINYWWKKDRSTDKSKDYPYSTVFPRPKNIFLQSVNPSGPAYRSLMGEINLFASKYGLSSMGKNISFSDDFQFVNQVEKPFKVELNADIQPKIVNREPLKINVKELTFDVPKPAELPAEATPPSSPNIKIDAFNPVAPNVVVPKLPEPPNLIFLAYPDCNYCSNESLSSTWNEDSSGTAYTDPNFFMYHRTWLSSNQSEGLVFKSNYLAYTPSNITSFNSYDSKNRTKTIKIDSYNPSKSFKDHSPIAPAIMQDGHTTWPREGMPNSGTSYATDIGKARNRQYFLIGGSRGIELDEGDSGILLPGITVEMGGPLVFGFVKQDDHNHSAYAINYGTITDKTEKDDKYIAEMPIDKDNYLENYYVTTKNGTEEKLMVNDRGESILLGPRLETSPTGEHAKYAEYRIRKSKDGYVGYKIGLAQIEEEDQGGTVTNLGEIDLRGEKSIGVYIYLPKKNIQNQSPPTKLTISNDRKLKSEIQFDNAKGVPDNLPEEFIGKVSMSGKNSYAMKYSAQQFNQNNHNESITLTFENNGELHLRKNPDGIDRADSSVGMAVTVDSSLSGKKVDINRGIALNNEKGKIFLEDNIENSIGQYINIASDLTNKGTITISAIPEDDSGLNVASYAKQVDKTNVVNPSANIPDNSTIVKNEDTGKIQLLSKNSIGMVADGVTATDPSAQNKEIFGFANALNSGTISNYNDENLPIIAEDIFGMISQNGGHIQNTGKIEFAGSKNNVGMAITLTPDDINGLRTSSGENSGTINIISPKSSAVFNQGKFTMSGGNINVSGEQSIGIYSKGVKNNNSISTTLNGGTITSSNFAVGVYPDDTTIDLNNTNNLKLEADNKGLLFYTYSSSNPLVASGKFNLVTDVDAHIKAKGTGFYLKSAEVKNDGTVAGIKTFMDNMLTTETGKKLNVTIDDGGTFVILYKPTGDSILLSTLNTASALQNSLGENVNLIPTGTKYKAYSIYAGKIKVDADSDIDSPDAGINKLEFASSQVTIDKGVKLFGHTDGSIAVYQSNVDDPVSPMGVEDVFIQNNGTISLTGNSVISGTTVEKTTTGMAGNFITLTNNGTIEVSGLQSMGIYGSNGSVITNTKDGIIKLGEKGIGIFSNNQLGTSPLGDKSINITNAGQIAPINSTTNNLLGIYAKNDPTTFPNATAKVSNTDSSIIDFSNGENNIGIFVDNTDLDNKGTIKVGKNSTAIKVIDSNVNDSGNISLLGKALAYNLSGNNILTKTLNLNSNVTLSGDDNAIFFLKGVTLDHLDENINIVDDNAGKYTYLSLDNSNLTYNPSHDKVLSANGITFISALNSITNIDANLTLNGKSSVGVYVNGIKAGTTEKALTTAAGKNIVINGNKSAALYVKNASVENNSTLTVGTDGVGVYVEGAGHSVTNNGNISISDGGTGIYLKNVDNFTQTGKVTSTSTNAIAIASLFDGTTPFNWENNGEIELTGDKSEVGIYTNGTGNQIITNNKPITVGDTIDNIDKDKDHLNIGAYLGAHTKLTNNSKFNVGKNSIGVYGYAVDTTEHSEFNVKESSIGIYSQNGDLNINGKMTLENGKNGKETIGIYSVGSNVGITLNPTLNIQMKDNSIGLTVANENGNNTITSQVPTISMTNESTYIYSKDEKGSMNSSTNISSTGNGNYGYYVAGNLTNTGNIDFSAGSKNIGIYSATSSGNNVEVKNSGIIKVGKSNIDKSEYSIGMAAGYYSKDNSQPNKIGHIINEGTISVDNPNGIGMYAIEDGSILENKGNIIINAPKGIGMYLGKNATGINQLGATIHIKPNADGATGVYIGEGAVFRNYGDITIDAPGSKGIMISETGKNVTSSEDSNVKDPKIASGVNATAIYKYNGIAGNDKVVGDVSLTVHAPNDKKPTIVKVGGVQIEPTAIDFVDVSSPTTAVKINDNTEKFEIISKLASTNVDLGGASKIGMYIDSSGINFTNPINGLENVRTESVDLIVGSEAGNLTNAKAITLGPNILERYNTAIANNPQINQWNVLSGSLTWIAAPNMYNGTKSFNSIVLAKIPYTEFSKTDENVYNFLDGLEQRYDKNSIFSREKVVFNKLNTIGKNEELLFKQAVNEMLGNQYGNTFRRVMASHDSFYREFDDLMKWKTETKDTMKVKLFGDTTKHRANAVSLKSYDRNVQGVFILNNNETVRLGQSQGLFAGIANEQFKFKDIGKSREKVISGEIGYYKSNAYGYNNELNWTWKAGIDASYRKMDRRYLVVDDIFSARAKYHSYGVFLDNTVGRNYRVTERLVVEPYAGIDLALGKVSKIRENSGEIRLDVTSKDYYSIVPNAGIMAKYNIPMNNKEIVTSIDVNLSKQLGNILDSTMKARVNRTEAGYYNLAKDKRDNANLGIVGRIGFENQDYGMSLKAGYSTYNKDLNGGVEFRIKF